jgi:hypothetical protein
MRNTGIHPDLRSRWPDPIDIRVLRERAKRERRFAETMGEVLALLMRCAYRNDRPVFDRALTLLGASGSRRRTLEEIFERERRRR